MLSIAGRWRITEMELWDQEAMDLVEPAFIEFGQDKTGNFGFIAVRGWMDCRDAPRDAYPGVDFSWEGLRALRSGKAQRVTVSRAWQECATVLVDGGRAL